MHDVLEQLFKLFAYFGFCRLISGATEFETPLTQAYKRTQLST